MPLDSPTTTKLILLLLALFSNSLTTSSPLLLGGGASSTFSAETSLATWSSVAASLSFGVFFVVFDAGGFFFPAGKELELALYFFLVKLEPFA